MNQITQDKLIFAIDRLTNIKNYLDLYEDLDDAQIRELAGYSLQNTFYVNQALTDIAKLEEFLKSIITEAIANNENHP